MSCGVILLGAIPGGGQVPAEAVRSQQRGEGEWARHDGQKNIAD